MTHYTIDYSTLNHDPIAKHNKAIEDTKEYFGQERFDKLVKAYKNRYGDKPPKLELFELQVSFGGIEGYPAKALYNHIWGL